MSNIGIIAGGGKLPIAIGRNLIKKKYNICFFVIEEFFHTNNYQDFDVTIINLKSAKTIINLLKSKNIDSIIMAGNINRPSLTDLSFDYQTFKLAKNLLLNKTGDNSLLVSIKKYFMDNGFGYFDWKEHCPELFANNDNLTKLKPTRKAKDNLNKAVSIFKSFGKIDVGQSMIIQNQIVLGLEAVEGTDNLMIRCKDYKKSGDRGILVKFTKYKQSNILDIPTIGQKTIKLLKECDYEGIFLEKDSCLIIDKEKTVDLANQFKVFISTCNKIE
ncbi:UDP-2,3-diacylglucosamine diphosphatase LpxI [Alphaproteobacteria bacterium]|nr:UDP-2,3-diacylglucosamine diphosphatase LpxI [Alphaproteobacteria bacterium]